MHSFQIIFHVLLSLIVIIYSVDRSKFRTCESTGFCRLYRQKTVGPVYNEHYKLDQSKSIHSKGLFQIKVIAPSGLPSLNLQVMFHTSGSIRVKLSEDLPRWKPMDLLLNDGIVLTDYKVLQDKDSSLPIPLHFVELDSFIAMKSNSNIDSVIVLYFSPLKVELYHENVLQISLNERSLLHFDSTLNSKDGHATTSTKSGNTDTNNSGADRHGGKTVVDYGEDGLATYADGTKEERKEENIIDESITNHNTAALTGDNFGGHQDSMPRGPRSVGLDISFPYAEHVYGIPEHTTSLSLPTTSLGSAQKQPRYREPYRLYNLDVFEYEIGETMALYGNIPLLIAHGKRKTDDKSMTSGIFWFNPSETFVDISDGGTSNAPYKQSRWLSESGEVDVFLLPGPDVSSVYKQYTALTGTQQLPPMFSLGYHQCRWNYRDERDIASVEGMFEQLDYPMDVLWLDIEHTDGKRYFTWDDRLFPNPIEMQQNISRHGRKMVTIVDPHLKRDDQYFIHKEATAKQLYIKNKEGGDFDGWCWPGSSSYLDFTSSTVREWWARQFGLDKYIGSTLDLFTWNDMNEPSVFNGPEVSMPKDAKNLQGVEHREWHNLYGIYMQMATALGLTLRSPGATTDPSKKLRPFVLTRSFWAGSQRHGAMWTGDNSATWEHLQISAPMLLSINLAGLSFAGADVGGFFGEPSAELFTRWYQAGAFTPFFRGHAHHDTKRREPWVFGEPYTSILRSAAMLRYTLLPYWYSVFYEAYISGMPVMRAMFMEFPEDASTYAMDHQWMIGSSLLVCPITQQGHTSIGVYLPSKSTASSRGVGLADVVTYHGWYDLETLELIPSATSEGELTIVNVPLSKIPVFIRPGSIVPRKLRLRRSSKLMFFDPYTLVVAIDSVGNAEGMVYLDDEQSLAHEISSLYSVRSLVFADNILTCSDLKHTLHKDKTNIGNNFDAINTIERVVIAGQQRVPSKVVLSSISSGTKVSSSSSNSNTNQDNMIDEVELSFSYDENKQVLTIKKPDIRVVNDWKITLYV